MKMRNGELAKSTCRHVNFLSRVLHVPAPTPVTTSDRCHVPHCSLVL